MFENSIRSKELLDYFNRKFGSALAVIVLLKCCAVVSCKLEWPRVSVLHVAPTRALKSFTSTEVMRIFTEEYLLELEMLKNPVIRVVVFVQSCFFAQLDYQIVTFNRFYES